MKAQKDLVSWLVLWVVAVVLAASAVIGAVSTSAAYSVPGCHPSWGCLKACGLSSNFDACVGRQCCGKTLG
mgnify:CR=1 FL=1